MTDELTCGHKLLDPQITEALGIHRHLLNVYGDKIVDLSAFLFYGSLVFNGLVSVTRLITPISLALCISSLTTDRFGW